LLGVACPPGGCALFPGILGTGGCSTPQGGGHYVGGMTENPDETRAASEDPVRDATGREEPAGDETDLSTKLDPDFIPQQGESPDAKRAREHPEETGS
jgi:hypothetical protein